MKPFKTFELKKFSVSVVKIKNAHSVNNSSKRGMEEEEIIASGLKCEF